MFRRERQSADLDPRLTTLSSAPRLLRTTSPAFNMRWLFPVQFRTTGLCAILRKAPVYASIFFAMAVGLTVTNASAQNAARDEIAVPQSETETLAPAPKAGIHRTRPFYIEFRARNAQSYGHTFLIHGRLDQRGNALSKTVAGLHPFTESPVPWMVGHLILVPSETGASDGDVDDQYTIARFRLALSAEEYRRVTNFIRELQAKSPVWHAVFYNCNAFVGVVARFMGLQTPSSLQLPESYINGIRDLNKAMPNRAMIGLPMKVESPETLRRRALKVNEKTKRIAVTATD